MDFLGGLRKLLGLGGNTQQAQPVQKVAEDSAPVNTPTGTMPLSSVQQGQPWTNTQTGYSPTGDQFQAPNFGSVLGSINPVWQQQQGQIPSIFGQPTVGVEKPVNQARYDQILKQRR